MPFIPHCNALVPKHKLPLPALCAVPYLMQQRKAITNWDAFAAANNYSGWADATPFCDWTGIICIEEFELGPPFKDLYPVGTYALCVCSEWLPNVSV